ncbi:MAG: hypothetical protein K8R53_15510 [Bacteroidales bacterium]|nr:hypothetical protein [Bacteroidales bacterium]
MYKENFKNETLAPIIHKNGFEYSLILRGKRSCIYKQRVGENCHYYEVFILKIKPERIVNGKILIANEAFPHNEAFGEWAWSYRNYEKALEKFFHLEKTEQFKMPDKKID